MSSTDERMIRRLMQEWTNGVNNKDWAALKALYAPEIVLFDVVPPLAFTGADVRDGFVEWFDWYSSAINYEMSGPRVTVHGELAFCHSLDRVSGSLKNGEETDYWLRHTVCFRKADDSWLIVHQHASLPVRIPAGDLNSGEVVLATP